MAALKSQTLSRASFDAVAGYFLAQSGIRLGPEKHALVQGRVQRLAFEAGARCLDEFVSTVMQGDDDVARTRLVDRLTTNETYFFREPEHFQFLGEVLSQVSVRDQAADPFRIWSAASSTGEEAFSIAMVLADRLQMRRAWAVVGTDLSTEVVQKANRGLYPVSHADDVPEYYLRRFCLKGNGPHAGQMLMARDLRERTRFLAANLLEPLPDIGMFDVIFLRNMLIYFDMETKADIVRRVLTRLKPGGYLLPGHSESLINLDLPIQPVRTAVYRHE